MILLSFIIFCLFIGKFGIMSNPDEEIENGRFGPMRILVPWKYRDRTIPIKFTDKMIISDERARKKFFRPKPSPCSCEDCAKDQTCTCKKMSKLRIEDGKLARYNVKNIIPWSEPPIVPCTANCKCAAQCGSCPIPISPERLYIGYNEKTKFGLYAADSIAKGELIGEYIGEVFLNEKGKDLDYTYMIPIDDDPNTTKTDYALIDASRNGNHTALANHSCSPSAEAVYYYVLDPSSKMMHPTTGIFAMREIKLNEEITINYGEDYWKGMKKKGFQCFCGSSACFEKIGFSEDTDEELNDDTSIDDDDSTTPTVSEKRRERDGNSTADDSISPTTSEKMREQLIAELLEEIDKPIIATSNDQQKIISTGKKNSVESSTNSNNSRDIALHGPFFKSMSKIIDKKRIKKSNLKQPFNINGQSKSSEKNNDAKRPKMHLFNAEEDNDKIKLCSTQPIFMPNTSCLVSEIQRIFCLSMEPFGIKVNDTNDSLDKLSMDFSSINPQTMFEHLKKKFLTDKFIENNQIWQRIEDQIAILFDLQPDNFKHQEHTKVLLFFYMCLLRRLIGLLEMPYIENDETGKAIDALTKSINKVLEQIKGEFKKHIVINKEFAKKFDLLTQIEKHDQIKEVISLIVFGIEVIMTPIIREQIFEFKDGKIKKKSFKKLDELSKNDLMELIESKKNEDIVKLWHLSMEHTTEKEYWKNQLTVISRINALVNSIVAQRTQKKINLLSNAMIYRMFFINLKKYVELGVEETHNQKNDMEWNSLKSFIDTNMKQLDEWINKTKMHYVV